MSTTASNSPIEQLIAEYEAEACDFKNVEFLINSSYRYVDTMPDSQVRCLLYSLAKLVDKHIPEEIRKPIAVLNPAIPEARRLVNEALENAATEISALLGMRDVKIKLKSMVRKVKYKNGGEAAKLSISADIGTFYNRGHDYKKIIHRQINQLMEANGLSKVMMTMSSGSQTKFNARVYIEGDEDYEYYKRFSMYNE